MYRTIAIVTVILGIAVLLFKVWESFQAYAGPIQNVVQQ